MRRTSRRKSTNGELTSPNIDCLSIFFTATRFPYEGFQ